MLHARAHAVAMTDRRPQLMVIAAPRPQLMLGAAPHPQPPADRHQGRSTMPATITPRSIHSRRDGASRACSGGRKDCTPAPWRTGTLPATTRSDSRRPHPNPTFQGSNPLRARPPQSPDEPLARRDHVQTRASDLLFKAIKETRPSPSEEFARQAIAGAGSNRSHRRAAGEHRADRKNKRDYDRSALAAIMRLRDRIAGASP